MSEPIKLPGLKTPIALDSVAVATHVLQPDSKDVSTDSFQQQLNTQRSAQVERAGRLLLKRPPQAPAPPLPLKLDVEGFLTDLASNLKDVEGFIAQIQYPDPKNPGGRVQDSRNGGWAIDPADPRSLAWSTGCPMHVASVSKLITAVAMTRALRDYEIPPDTAIAGYLPYFWAQGPNIGKITFRQLLTHRSGIVSGSTDYASIKTQVNNGVTAANIGVYAYANMNFSLCRMLLASILMLVVTYSEKPVPGAVPGGTHHTPEIGGPIPPTLVPLTKTRVVTFVNQWPADDNSRDLLSIQVYQSYVIENVLTAGETARFTHAPTDALAYAYPKPPNMGWNSGDLSACVGAAGWHFSTTDLLRVMGDFRRGGVILTQAEAQRMLDDSFGIDWIGDDGAGTFYEKDGYWSDGSQAEQSTVFFLPDETELVVLVNSTVGASNGTWVPWVVEPAYKAHLVAG